MLKVRVMSRVLIVMNLKITFHANAFFVVKGKLSMLTIV